MAFGHDSGALLIVKVANADVHPAGRLALEQACASHRNVILTCETMSDQGLTDLLAGADAVLSLHRAEGFGLLLAHAMHFGRPIIATDWSASCEFLTSDNACLVPATLAPARDPQQTYDYPEASWAEPSIPSAADWLRRLRTDRSFAIAVGRKAQKDAAALLGPSRLAALRAAVLGPPVVPADSRSRCRALTPAAKILDG
jgi:glycosyltransferase involved in cell wall biosynthesis